MDKNEGTSKRNLRRSPGISCDEILEGRPAVKVDGQCRRSVRAPWLARNRHSISRFPADSLPLSTWPVLSFRSGKGVPPPVYILYLYSHLKRGQNEGNFPAFEDKLRFTERSPRTNPFCFRLRISCRELATKYFNRKGSTTQYSDATIYWIPKLHLRHYPDYRR